MFGRKKQEMKDSPIVEMAKGLIDQKIKIPEPLTPLKTLTPKPIASIEIEELNPKEILVYAKRYKEEILKLCTNGEKEMENGVFLSFGEAFDLFLYSKKELEKIKWREALEKAGCPKHTIYPPNFND